MDREDSQESQDRDEWRSQLYNLLVETSAKLDAHIGAEDRMWRQFREDLKEHQKAIGKLEQTVNNGIYDKVHEVHKNMEKVKREMPGYVNKEEKRKDVSLQVSVIAMGISAVAAFSSLVFSIISVFGG